MAQKDYVRRSGKASARRKKGTSQSANKASALMIGIAVLVVLAFIGGLFFIAHHDRIAKPAPLSQKTTGNGLPPKPEERWRYIKELENRKSGVTTPAKPTSDVTQSQHQLTAEQRQLLEQIQADMRQPPMQLNEVPWNGQPPALASTTPATSTETVTLPGITYQTAPVPQVPATTTAANQQKRQSATEEKQATTTQQYWMVQCGSFKNREQAETMRVKLAFEGFESHINSSDDWQRVVIGPFSNKDRVDSTLERLKAAGHSTCIRLRL